MARRLAICQVAIGNDYGIIQETVYERCKLWADYIVGDYICLTENLETSGRPNWNKLSLIQNVFDFGYDHIIYLDMDCLVSNIYADPFSVVKDGKSIGAVYYGDPYNHWNTGFLALKKTDAARTFLDAVSRGDRTSCGKQQEEREFNRLVSENPEYARIVQDLGIEWNYWHKLGDLNGSMPNVYSFHTLPIENKIAAITGLYQYQEDKNGNWS